MRSEYLVITTEKSPPIEQIIELLGDPRSTEADTAAPRGQRVTWHHYFWLDFGTVGGKVVSVRLNCLMTPNYGLDAR